jgi:hypothetical protein
MQLIDGDLNKFNLFNKKAQVDKVHERIDEADKQVDGIDKRVDGLTNGLTG